MPEFKWFNNVRRYRSPNGRFVSNKAVGDYVDKLTQTFSSRLRTRTETLVSDFSNSAFSNWATKTRNEIAVLHNAVTALALGGKKAVIQFAQQNSETWTQAERGMGVQLQYWDRFMLAILSGQIPLNNAMAVRASMYPLAGFATFQNVVRLREQLANGFNEERRILRSQNPCRDCIAEAAKDWQPIGTLRIIGDSVCISRCRCYFEYRKI